MQPLYRRCVSCRRLAHRDGLLRVVRNHLTGNVQLNSGMGRSAYLCPKADCISLAQKKNRLGRSLKASVPADIYQKLHRQIKQSENDLYVLDKSVPL